MLPLRNWLKSEECENHSVERSGWRVRIPEFRKGTEIVANAIADSEAFSMLAAATLWQQSTCSALLTKSLHLHWRRRIPRIRGR